MMQSLMSQTSKSLFFIGHCIAGPVLVIQQLAHCLTTQAHCTTT